MAFYRTTGIALALILLMPIIVRADSLPTFGYLEKIRVGPTDLLMRAKLDTGADTSSLGYKKIEFFEKNTEKWVRINVRNIEGRSFEIERQIVRISTIKRHKAPSVERPVIRVSMCLGNIHRLTEVSLTDRSDFSVPILIGRSFLAGTAIVDSAREYTTPPDCIKGGAK